MRINWIIRVTVVPPLILAALCLLDIGWASFYGPGGITENLDILTLSVVYVCCVSFVWWVIGLHGVYDRFVIRPRELDEKAKDVQ